MNYLSTLLLMLIANCYKKRFDLGLNFLISDSGSLLWSTFRWCYCERKNSSYYGSCNSYKCKPSTEIADPIISKLVSFLLVVPSVD